MRRHAAMLLLLLRVGRLRPVLVELRLRDGAAAVAALHHAAHQQVPEARQAPVERQRRLVLQRRREASVALLPT